MARPACPPPITTTLVFEGTETVMTLSRSFVKRGDGHTARGVIETPGGGLEPCELADRARAGKAVFFPHAVAGDGQRRSAAVQEFRDVIGRAGGEMFVDPQRGRIALLGRAVRPANIEQYLRHAAAPSAAGRPADAHARC